MAKREIKFPYKFFVKYIDGKVVTFKAFLTDKKYTWVGFDKNYNPVYFLAKNIDYIPDDDNLDNIFKRYFKCSQVIHNRGELTPDANYIVFLNKKYFIKALASNKNSFEIIQDKIYLHLTDEKHRSKLIFNAYVSIALPYLEKRVKYWSKKMNSRVDKIRIKDISSAFAYYSYKDRTITFSTMCLYSNSDVLDYLIIHELAHYFESNHQKKFWDIVQKYCPEYKKLNKQLSHYII